MGRSDDPFWNEVEHMNDGSMKCKFCGLLFANGTSISRIKWHLSGERGHGVGICGQVPKEVQEAAFLASLHVGNKRQKSIASSSNVDISTCPQEQDNAVLGNLAQGIGRERIHSRLEAANGMENTGEGSFQHVDRSVSPWRLRVDAYENRGEATQRTDLADQFADSTWVQIHSALSKAQKLNEISTYLMQEDEDVERLHDAFETVPRTEQVQHLERGSSCERPSINQADEPRGDSSQPTDPLCLDHGRYYDQLFAPSVNNDVIMYDVQNMVRVRTEPVEEGVENSGRLVQPGALFPEDDRIKRKRLIGYLIDEGIIKGKRSRGDAFDEGHTMLNRLENVCLLESAKIDGDDDDSRRVKMHDLIRDMAIQILLENSQGMVKAGAQLKELPDAEEWMENLTRVSLMQNEIKEIPSSHSPVCPNLSTLFLSDNKQLHGLKVLDLSRTGIENLPDSVSDLLSLTAFLLNDCRELRLVPSLKKLRALKRLDLSRTRLEKMPQGMECLTNLRYLRMNGCGEKEFPSGILPKLSHLQVFVLEQFMGAPITVKGKEVGSLRNLETLECHFEGFSDFVEYLRSRDGIQSLSTYTILVGRVDVEIWAEHIDDFPSKTVGLGNLSINGDGDFQVKILNGIQRLVCERIDARSLCDVLSLENATELEHISILDCHNMESLVSSSWFCYAPPRLPSYNGTFSGLKEFYYCGCNSMKNLFPLVLLPNLVNLERIDVEDCEKMEEIIGSTDEESSTSNSITGFIFPKLRTLELFDLPELKSICSAKLICNSLEEITVIRCQKLKRMPICLPLLENGQPSPPPSLKKIRALPEEWWESVVEWEHPNAKDVLRSFVK
ncbi:hypothetical protein BDE02_19G018000 [Populus trichocarpa]|nr:hypothetical protein BDE02_19G018000 [Populus trichocarpa]